MRQVFKSILEMLPLPVFLILYYWGGIIFATKGLLITSVATLIITYVLYRHIEAMPLFSNAILLFFGGMTIYSNDSTFIKMKPTFLYILLALILTYDIIKRKGWMRHVFGHTFDLSDEIYKTLSQQWRIFFIACAILNEVVWRNFSEEVWVQFKVFGILGMTITFSAYQIMRLSKHIKT